MSVCVCRVRAHRSRALTAGVRVVSTVSILTLGTRSHQMLVGFTNVAALFLFFQRAAGGDVSAVFAAIVTPESNNQILQWQPTYAKMNF